MKKIIAILCVFALFTTCKEVYKPALHSPQAGFLVVEGFINSGNDVTSIALSRTVKAEDETARVFEQNATVVVEGDNGENFPLFEKENGVYESATPLALNGSAKYRLSITTSEGKAYVSDFTPVKFTPPIDSISWLRDNGGVRIYVNAHDASNGTKYYQWKYTESWEFHARYLKYLDYQIDPSTDEAIKVDYGNPSPDTSIYKCWKTQHSTNILLGSTEKLSEDRVYLPVRFIPPQAEELTVLYRLQLKQYALSHEAYLFNQLMQQNSEQLGSIFDRQPTDLNSNVHSVSNPSEVVVGYVEVAQEQAATLYINNNEVRPWVAPEACPPLIIIDNRMDSIKPYRYNYLPVAAVTTGPFNTILTFSLAPTVCVDCTMRGTNVRPEGWPQ